MASSPTDFPLFHCFIQHQQDAARVTFVLKTLEIGLGNDLEPALPLHDLHDHGRDLLA